MDTTFKRRLSIYLALYLAWLLFLFWQTGGFAHPDMWLRQWVERWDAKWYEQIWRIGYPKEDPRTLVFPPGYPTVVGIVSYLANIHFFTAGLIINSFSFGIACVLATECLAQRLRIKSRVLLFAFMLSSPTAYLVFPAYSDPLFTAILWAALYVALLKPFGRYNSLVEMLLLLVMPWVRLTAYGLVSWLLLGRRSALALLCSLAVWMLMNVKIAGHAMYFKEAQHLYNLPRGNFFNGFLGAYYWSLDIFKKSLDSFDLAVGYLQFGFLPLMYFFLLCLVGGWFALKKEWLISITVLSIVAISHNRAFWLSEMRYDLPIMLCLGAPLFYIIQSTSSKFIRLFIWVLICAFAIIQLHWQVLFANQMAKGQWAF